MFSSIFGKRRSSPVEDGNPPIPGPRSEDGFVVVDPMSPGNSLYPSVPGASGVVRVPARPPPPVPQPRAPAVDQTFHYLQGVPFTLCRELKLATNKDAVVSEINDLLAFLTNRLNVNKPDYDFTVEKSVLKECS